MKKPIKVENIKRRKRYAEYGKILEEDETALKEYEINEYVSKNEDVLKKVFKGCSDIVFRPINIFNMKKGLVIYVKGLTDIKFLDSLLLKLLLYEYPSAETVEKRGIINIVEERIAAVGQIKTVASIDETVKNILSGNTVILVDGTAEILSVTISGGERRSVSEPVTEVAIRGPREGFTEDINTNISLLRRRLRTPKLKMDSRKIGEISQTHIIIAYLEGIAKDEIIREVKKRLDRIEIDGVLESGYIEEFIEDETYTPFPLVQNTERPDVVAANLLEGKIAIFTDNTPFVLIVPIVFWGQVHSNEDYFERFSMSTFLRGIRLVFMFVALIAPSIYVAITTFHQQMIPSKLLMSIIDNREPTPFPAVIEALMMEIIFEALREAGIRLPKPVGQAVSIVGALVIGQAAVQAGLISAPMVIVVSITGIASFTLPRYDFSFAIRVLRFPLIFLAGSFGLYGVTLGILGIFTHLVNLRSFGIPYFSPVAPLNIRELKDVFIRAPMWSMRSRPNLTTDNNELRVPTGQKPGPAQGNKNGQKDGEN